MTDPLDATSPSQASQADPGDLHRRGQPPPSSHLRFLARGGVLTFIGSLISGLLAFVFVFVVTRTLGVVRTGLFFQSVGLFTIVSNVCELGADTGLVRMIARDRAMGRMQDVRPTTRAALWPSVLASVVAGGVLFVVAPQLSELLVRGNGNLDRALVPFLRVLGVFLPFATASTLLLAATRGLGSMMPTVAVENILKATLRPIFLLPVGLAGLGGAAVALAWAGPIVPGLMVAGVAYTVILRRELRLGLVGAQDTRPPRELVSEFWRFAAPRGFAVVLNVTLFWLDTLMLGALRGPSDAGVYAAASRYLYLGFFALSAIQLVIAPQMSGLLAAGDRRAARDVYATATHWLILPSWPVYFTLIAFAPTLLALLGPGFEAGQATLAILATAMLFNTATGPCTTVLLAGGRSGWALADSAVALAVNVGLNLLLIPKLGPSGAALAWSVSILVNNLGAALQVRRFFGLSPFGRGFWVAVITTTVCFGAVGMLLRVVAGSSFLVFSGYAVLATALYLVMLIRSRSILRLPELRAALTSSGRTRR